MAYTMSWAPLHLHGMHATVHLYWGNTPKTSHACRLCLNSLCQWPLSTLENIFRLSKGFSLVSYVVCYMHDPLFTGWLKLFFTISPIKFEQVPHVACHVGLSHSLFKLGHNRPTRVNYPMCDHICTRYGVYVYIQVIATCKTHWCTLPVFQSEHQSARVNSTPGCDCASINRLQLLQTRAAEPCLMCAGGSSTPSGTRADKFLNWVHSEAWKQSYKNTQIHPKLYSLPEARRKPRRRKENAACPYDRPLRACFLDSRSAACLGARSERSRKYSASVCNTAQYLHNKNLYDFSLTQQMPTIKPTPCNLVCQ